MEEIIATIRATFPLKPVPNDFFVHDEEPQQDMQHELSARIKGRSWSSLSLLDWRMVGSPDSYREYIAAQTFAYYVPSFLVGVMAEPEFLYLAVEAILPNNRSRIPRGAWWASFAAGFTDPQRAAIKGFLAFHRETAATFDLVDVELIGAAENIWT